jgi:hypothetical protein
MTRTKVTTRRRLTPLALLVVGLCLLGSTASSQSVDSIDGSGLVGSVRRQTNMAPVQSKDQLMGAHEDRPRVRRQAGGLVAGQGAELQPPRDRAKLTDAYQGQQPQQQQQPEQLADKLRGRLETARQFVQELRERCAEGYEPRQEEPRRGLPGASGGSSSKLSELGEKVRNKTEEARQVVHTIRQHCAETLGGAGTGASSAGHREQQHYQNEQPHHQHHHEQSYQHQHQHQHQQHHQDRLRRQAPQSATDQVSSALANTQQTLASAFGQVGPTLSAFGEQVRSQTNAAVGQLQSFGNQLASSVNSAAEKQQVPKLLRRRRQVTNVAQESAASSSQSGAGGVLKYLNDLSQQAAQAQAIQQFLTAASDSIAQGGTSANSAGKSAASGPSSTGTSGLSTAAQALAQLNELIKSTQDRSARLVESSRRNLESSVQQSADTAKEAQTGVQAALNEMRQGLQRLANNNPNLLQDLKNLYQSVAARLSAASSSVAQSVGGAGAGGQQRATVGGLLPTASQ